MGEPLDRDALVSVAARAEGHPDNVSAALLGGLTVSCADGDRVTAVSLSVPPEIAWVVPGPSMIPPAQVNTPVTVRSPAPPNEPLFRVNVLLITEGLPRESVLPDRTIASWLLRPAMVVFPWEWVTVTSAGTSISTRSPGCGTLPVLQLLGSCQKPSPLVIQRTTPTPNSQVYSPGSGLLARSVIVGLSRPW
ncbi:MAG: hypothetical protein L0322_03735 [Chloroflexi bacterium]|nr:hypothetical protein [Chloroflexota bacterium]